MRIVPRLLRRPRVRLEARGQDVEPLVGRFARERFLGISGIRVAGVVPRRLYERIHRVGLSPRRFRARRALHIDEARVRLERIAVPRKFHVGR